MALPAGTTVINGFALTPDGALYVTLGGGTAIGSGITGNQAIAQSIGVPFSLSRSGIPFVSVATGTMGNNGAMTVGTALPRTYSAGAYFFMPIGSIAAGIPAAATWYWGVASSGTAVTLYNSVYTSGTPAAGVLTAFATTGPGAFTGDTSEQGVTITIPANSLGASGMLRITSMWEATNNANGKTTRIRLGGIAGTTYLNATSLASQLSVLDIRVIQNAGATNLQVGPTTAYLAIGTAVGSALTTSAVDTTASTTLVLTVQKATATDNLVLSNYGVEVGYSP